MSKTNKERILDYLWSITPERATNSQIRAATGISSHQQVYLLTQELMRTYIRVVADDLHLNTRRFRYIV